MVRRRQTIPSVVPIPSPYTMEKQRFEQELQQLQQKKQDLEELNRIKAQIREEKQAIEDLQPKSWLRRLFEKNEY